MIIFHQMIDLHRHLQYVPVYDEAALLKDDSVDDDSIPFPA